MTYQWTELSATWFLLVEQDWKNGRGQFKVDYLWSVSKACKPPFSISIYDLGWRAQQM